MSSLFSLKSKPQKSSLSSKANERSDLPTGCCDSGSKLTFSRMRKRRPLPINISLGDTNIFISAMNSNAAAKYLNMPCQPIPPHTYHPPGHASRICRDKESAMLMPPPLSPCSRCQRFWPTPVGPSRHPQSPTTQYFPIAAELPGSVVGPAESVELDVPSTSIRKPLENSETRLMRSSPDKIHSSSWDNGLRVVDSDRSEPHNRRSNDKLCSDMDFWEPLETLPGFSADDIREQWHPAIVKQARCMDRGNPKLGNDVGVDAANMRKELYTLADLETMKQDCEEQVKAKEMEIVELRQFHESRFNALCTFILNHSGHELAQSTDTELNEALTDILVNQNCQHPGELLLSLNKDRTKYTETQSRFRSQSYPQELQTSVLRMPRTEYGHRNTTLMNNPKSDPRASSADTNGPLKFKQYEATTRHLKQDLQQNDPQIAVLNSKVTQLLNAGPSTSMASSSLKETVAEAEAAKLLYRPDYAPKTEKDLPPLPCPPTRSRRSDSNLDLKRAPGSRRKISSVTTRMAMTGATTDTRFSIGASIGTEARPGLDVYDAVYRTEASAGETSYSFF